MRNATRVTVGTFGGLAALAGFEHGVGEVLQGSVAPASLMFASWPGSPLFRTVNGEPAMSLISNLLVTGILAILVSLAFVAWAIFFVQRTHGGLVLILLSVVLLLVGGGFGPPILGVVVGLAATKVDAPLTWWRAHLPTGFRSILGRLWPWLFATGVIAWLLLFPGSVVMDYAVGPSNPSPVGPDGVFLVAAFALGFLLLTILTGYAHDSQRQVVRTVPPS